MSSNANKSRTSPFRYFLMGSTIVIDLQLISVILIAFVTFFPASSSVDINEKRFGHVYPVSPPKTNIRTKIHRQNTPRLIESIKSAPRSNLFDVRLFNRHKKSIRSHKTHFKASTFNQKRYLGHINLQNIHVKEHRPNEHKRGYVPTNSRSDNHNYQIFSSTNTVEDTNFETKGNLLRQINPTFKKLKKTQNTKLSSEKIRSRFNEEDDLLLNQELELKIQEDRDRQTQFNRIQQILKNKKFKELQVIREKKNAIRYTNESKQQDTRTLETRKQILNVLPQKDIDKGRVRVQRLANR